MHSEHAEAAKSCPILSLTMPRDYNPPPPDVDLPAVKVLAGSLLEQELAKACVQLHRTLSAHKTYAGSLYDEPRVRKEAYRAACQRTVELGYELVQEWAAEDPAAAALASMAYTIAVAVYRPHPLLLEVRPLLRAQLREIGDRLSLFALRQADLLT